MKVSSYDPIYTTITQFIKVSNQSGSGKISVNHKLELIYDSPLSSVFDGKLNFKFVM